MVSVPQGGLYEGAWHSGSKQGIGVRVMRSGAYKVRHTGSAQGSVGRAVRLVLTAVLQAGRWEADQLVAAMPLEQCQAAVQAARSAAAHARRCCPLFSLALV